MIWGSIFIQNPLQTLTLQGFENCHIKKSAVWPLLVYLRQIRGKDMCVAG